MLLTRTRRVDELEYDDAIVSAKGSTIAYRRPLRADCFETSTSKGCATLPRGGEKRLDSCGMIGAQCTGSQGPVSGGFPLSESRIQPSGRLRAWLAIDLRAPDVAAFAGADGNKVTHYMLRWENTCDETGPWSEAATATIGA